MGWSNDREVASIECGDLDYAQSFRRGHDRGVDCPKRQVAVLTNQRRDAEPVFGGDRLIDEVAGGEVAEEPDLSVGPEAGRQEVGDLGHDQDRHEERTGMSLDQLEALDVMVIVLIDIGVEGPGVDEDGYRVTSVRKISSIRTETSCWPLRPAFAASICRRPSLRAPRCVSIASRVSSETVIRLRSASWRSRASKSSGSFSVVRFMVCQHTAPHSDSSVSRSAGAHPSYRDAWDVRWALDLPAS